MVDSSDVKTPGADGTVTVRGVGSAFEPIRNISDPLTFRNYLTTG